MRHWVLPAATGAVMLASGSASSAQALISGNYVLDDSQSDDVIQAVDSAVAGLSNATRAIVRTRMRKSCICEPWLRMSSIAGRFSIKESTKPLIDLWTGGEPIKWQLNDGQVFDVSAKADGEAVSLTVRGVYSEETIVYRSVGQQLVAETTIVSPRSSTPIRYRLVYNQAK